MSWLTCEDLHSHECCGATWHCSGASMATTGLCIWEKRRRRRQVALSGSPRLDFRACAAPWPRLQSASASLCCLGSHAAVFSYQRGDFVSLCFFYVPYSHTLCFREPRKLIAMIKDEGLGRGKTDWIAVRATITYIRSESFCYPACPLQRDGRLCSKKVVREDNNVWRCESCQKSVEQCDYRYTLNFQVGGRACEKVSEGTVQRPLW